MVFYCHYKNESLNSLSSFQSAKSTDFSLQSSTRSPGRRLKWDVLVAFSSWFNEETETGIGSGTITQWWNETPRDPIHGIKTKRKQKRAGTGQASGPLWPRSTDAKCVVGHSIDAVLICHQPEAQPLKNGNADIEGNCVLNCCSHCNCFCWLTLVSWLKVLGEKPSYFVCLSSCKWLPHCASAGQWFLFCESIFYALGDNSPVPPH